MNNPINNKAVVYPKSVSLLISACFFFSGLAGLIYEVVWARQLSLFLGITTYAHTAVITAYMAGLAAGSLYFGRRADRHPQPLKIYAWLEVGVGVYAAMTPWLFNALQFAYVSIADVSTIGQMSGHLTRFSIALLALLVPTFLMGGTLPLLVRGFVTELPALGRVTSRLYGINTLGAVLGTLLAGYLLLPGIGVKATIFVGVVINLAIAAVVFAISHRAQSTGVAKQTEQGEVTTRRAEPEEAMPPGLRYVLLLGFGTTGFAALLTQMAWIRALILVVGGSVYAFTITLASFLAGIGLGSLFFTRFLANPGNWLANSWLKGRRVQAALLALLISLTLLLGLPLIGKLPGLFLAGYAAGLHSNFALFQLFIFALCSSVIIMPTLFMGILFPLVTVIWTPSVGLAGRGVGAAYAINTAGTILGALLGGLLILPWLGVHYSIQMAAGLYFLVAVAFWLISNADIRNVHKYAIIVSSTLFVMMIAWLIPAWDKMLMSSGVFSNPDSIIKQSSGEDWQHFFDEKELLYYGEGLDGIVAVINTGDNKALVINGKTDASSSFDLPTQVLFGQLPLALKPDAESALVIGLGSGITPGTLATSESLRRLTILEISEKVIEASEFFKTENYAVLADPRVSLVTADARNHLMASPELYDIIISEPSNPWITGISNLFTDEFFRLAKSRLNPGGIMAQWFHTYSMSNSDLKTLLKTFENNFQYVTVWLPLFEDMLVIGTDQPHAISMGLESSAAKLTSAKELSRAKIYNDRDLIRSYLIGGDLLSGYVEESRLNSDYNPVVEFNAPKYLYSLTTRENLEGIFNYLEGKKVPVPVTGLVRQTGDFLEGNFMHLKVVFDKNNAMRNVRPQWLVSQLLLEEKGNRTYGMVGSERVLTWTEGSVSYQVLANWLHSSPDIKELTSMLDKLPVNRHGGIIKLHDDIDAVWLINKKEESSELLLDLSWDCPANPSGFTHFNLNVSLPDPGQDNWGNTLNSLASRFHCY
ncbi:fused MFS/spermidine synthase [Pseudomonadota bacterium]